MTTAVQDSRPLHRAVRKIKCASMVNSLARSWQTWASEHSGKQESIPKGWIPSSLDDEDDQRSKKTERKNMPHSVTPRTLAENGPVENSKIKSVSVTKSIAPKKSDCGNDLVSFITEKIKTKKIGAGDRKPFLGNESPTRRRHCGNKGGAGVKAWVQQGKEEGWLGSRSSSLDTEDSGLGEEAGLSDTDSSSEDKHKDSQQAREKRLKDRPKIKVVTLSDLRSTWQKWSEQHLEEQKLNPFSEEFDYEHAMATRLHIRREMDEMCFIIRDMGMCGQDGQIRMTFGRLFDRYVKISDKVVGILLRCRKHGMVAFEGEMLWKGQDDDVIITLLV
ncbi:ABRA protein, partial [Amia calva]|nr:ABRA protein [Amia calva]